MAVELVTIGQRESIFGLSEPIERFVSRRLTRTSIPYLSIDDTIHVGVPLDGNGVVDPVFAQVNNRDEVPAAFTVGSRNACVQWGIGMFRLTRGCITAARFTLPEPYASAGDTLSHIYGFVQSELFGAPVHEILINGRRRLAYVAGERFLLPWYDAERP